MLKYVNDPPFSGPSGLTKPPAKPPDLVDIQNSNIAGLGVFACKKFPKNSRIRYFRGVVVKNPTEYSLTLEGKIIDPERPLKHLNHSCAPNAHFVGRWLEAKREIEFGDEITIDYQATEENITHHFKCRCGESECRGSI